MNREYRRKGRDDSGNFLDSFLFKGTSKLFLGLTIIVIFLTVVQCTVKSPEAPQWDTQLSVPLVNRTYPMSELVGNIEDNGISMDSAGTVHYRFSQDLDTVSLDANNLSSADISYTLNQTLGPVMIDPPGGDVVNLPLAAIGGLSASLPGDQALIIPQSFALTNDLTINSSFSTADVSSGQAVVVVNNGLGVDLDTVIVGLVDIGLGLIGSGSIVGGIPSGGIDSVVIDLGGATMTSSLQLQTNCHTPGGTVTSASTRFVESTLSFPGQIGVTYAVAEIPALSRSLATQVALAESDRIDTANLAAGNLALTISNNTNLDASLTITIPDFELAGTPLQIVRSVGARLNQIVNIDLTGYKIVPSDRTVPQLLDLTGDVDLPGSGSTQIEVSSDDSFGIQAAVSGMQFSSVTGVFNSIGADFGGINEQIDVPNGFETVEIQLAIITVEIENTVDLPGTLDVLLTGDNGNSISLTGDIDAAGDSSSTTIFTITDSANFLAPIPANISVSGSAYFGDGVYQGTIEDADFIRASISVDAPLLMVIPASAIDIDIESVEIDQDDIDKIMSHLNSAVFTYNVISRLPVGANIEFYFGTDSANILTNYDLKLPKVGDDSINVPMGPVDQFGIVSDTVSTGYLQVMLDSTDTKILENRTLYIAPRITLSGSNGTAVRFSETDFITIIGHIEVNYRFDGEF